MAKKKVKGYIKLQVPAGQAKAGPPVGPVLGSWKLNIMDFCKRFNAETQSMESGTPVPVVLTVYTDNTFDMEMKLAPMAHFIKQALGIKKGSQTPGASSVGVLTKAQVREIALKKMPDLNLVCDMENPSEEAILAACRIVEGSARSMGVRVEAGGA